MRITTAANWAASGMPAYMMLPFGTCVTTSPFACSAICSTLSAIVALLPSISTGRLHRPPPPWHAPFAQVCPIAHGLLQPPQWATSVAVFTSQPSAGMLLQLAKAPVHGPRTRPPPCHVAAELGNEHMLVHPPQFFASVRRFDSHPLTGALSQSRNGLLQLPTPHAPTRHPGI